MFLRRYIENFPIRSVVICSTFFLFIGFLFSWYFSSFILGPQDQNQLSRSLRLVQSDYPLVNPLLLCSIDSKDSDEDKQLDSILTKFIADKKSKGIVSDMSVYIANYKRGQWTGVNEDDKYDPASMLKVPVMLAYYKYAETRPEILSEVSSYSGDDQNTDEYFKSTKDIKSGKSYSISELTKSMIINSDNNALTILENYIGKKYLVDVYTDMKLPVPSDGSNIDYLSARLYAYFFRILYNGTYLTRQYSETALDLLSKSEFRGIQAGVPAGVTVANKFGERSVYNQDGLILYRELHDCGIVYKKDSPYLLCIMSRGSDFDVLRQNIEDLSRLVYNYI